MDRMNFLKDHWFGLENPLILMQLFKERLKRGETLLGCWANLGSPVSAEILGKSGFDWVLVDYEHGAGHESDLLAHMQALGSTPAKAFVRVEANRREHIVRALDTGADGVMVPRVFSVEEAAEAVAAFRYPPDGTRGVARMTRATDFGVNFETFRETGYQDQLSLIQIETAEALEAVDSIAALDGVDVLFVGPADLSTALGIYGQTEHPDYQNAVEKIAMAARAAGKIAGVLMLKPEEFGFYHSLGYQLIASGGDSAFVLTGASSILQRFREQL